MDKIFRISKFLLFILLFSFDNYFCQHSPGPIRVSTDFDSGNLGKWYLENDTYLICYPYINCDQNGRNGVSIWFFGRVDNVLNREIMIHLKGMQEEYELKMGNSPYGGNTVPVFSYDLENWERFSNCRFDSSSNTFTIKHIFSRETVWIAYIEPYQYVRLRNLIKEMGNYPCVKIESIGKSIEERELYLVTVSEVNDTNLHPVVWIVARQHPWETASSWAVEGLMKYLVSDEPSAIEIRKNMTFKIIPMANPDGVVNGVTRFNAKGIDLNRHWNKEDPFSTDTENAPEIAFLKMAMKKWCAKNQIDLWINIHNNDMNIVKNPAYIDFSSPERENEVKRFAKYLTENSVFRGSINKISTDEKSTTSVVASEFNTLSILIEMEVGYIYKLGIWVDKDLHIKYGEGLARAIDGFFDTIIK
jgi:hypothetical protein